jgi:succinate dehydrogenase / fumarate reductase cytochrome b subunit
MEDATSVLGLVKTFLTRSIGKKGLMAVTGAGAIAFVIVHLFGNLIVFRGPEAFDAYGHGLHAIPFLFLAETGLGILFVTHVTLGVLLTLQNWAARPVGYRRQGSAGGKTLASSTMIYTGLLVLAFILLHLWTMVLGPAGEIPVFERVEDVFSVPWQTGAYMVGVVALGLHLFHGASSVLITLGLRHPLHDGWVDGVNRLVAISLAAGFLAIAGWFGLSAGGSPWPY